MISFIEYNAFDDSVPGLDYDQFDTDADMPAAPVAHTVTVTRTRIVGTRRLRHIFASLQGLTR